MNRRWCGGGRRERAAHFREAQGDAADRGAEVAPS